MESSASRPSDIMVWKPDNIAVITNQQHEIKVVDVEIPEVRADECLVHICATGICGSDVHFWKNGIIGSSVVTSDLKLGHESGGIVVKVGPLVESVSIGDKVAIEAGVACSKPTCFYCRTGQYNGCPAIVFYSSPPVDGTLRRYHAHPEAWLHRLPDHLSYEEGALLEPLSVALAGIDRSNLRLGDALAVCGAGPIGLVTLLVANAADAVPIAITDLDDNRLAMAKQLVPRVRTIKVEKDTVSQAVAKDIKTALGKKAKLVIECTEVESSIHAAIYVSFHLPPCQSDSKLPLASQATQFGGTSFVIGVGSRDFQSYLFMHASTRKIDLRFQ